MQGAALQMNDGRRLEGGKERREMIRFTSYKCLATYAITANSGTSSPLQVHLGVQWPECGKLRGGLIEQPRYDSMVPCLASR